MAAKSPTYMLTLLVCVVCVHNVDRMGFSIVLDDIKASMSLSDTQLGLLAGPAFALLNAAAAIPLARLADRYGRKTTLVVCLLLWSGFTSLSGVARSFGGLAAARSCIGFADAAASPVSQSLAASAYPQARRPGVLAILISGSYLGTVLGFLGTGAIAEILGWRSALIWMGIPGVVLGVVIWLTFKEPQEAMPPREAAAETVRRAWLTEWLPVVRQRVFFDAAMTVASGSVLGWVTVSWLPAFFHRSYAMGLEEIGFWLASTAGVGAAAGALAGGAISNRLYGRSPQAGLWLGFWTTMASAPLLTAAFVTDSKALCLTCVIASGVTGSVCMGPVYAIVQGLADMRTRATAAAVFSVANTLLGQALGPLLVGFISDLAARHDTAESLRVSLEIVSLLGFWPAIHLYRLAKGSDANGTTDAMMGLNVASAGIGQVEEH
jgi:MFS family permease